MRVTIFKKDSKVDFAKEGARGEKWQPSERTAWWHMEKAVLEEKKMTAFKENCVVDGEGSARGEK